MKKAFLHDRGFTLIELVTVLLIVAVLSTIAGMGLVNIANGYLLTKTSSVAAGQAQVALTRLTKELSKVRSITAPASSPVSATYTRYRDTEGSGYTIDTHTISWVGADLPITLDGDTLIDKVQSFRLTYYHYDYTTRILTPAAYPAATAVIELSFTLKGHDGTPLTFTERVAI